MKTPIISVVVCTYNGEALLPGCLQSLADQTSDADTFEVIIVNNNSTDKSQQVAVEFAKTHANFSVVLETEVGLSAARNRGFKEAKGEYISYLDDDAKASKDWIEEALKVIADKHPDIFGGPIHPFYEGEHISWVKDEYNSYSIYETGYLTKHQYLSGSNIFIAKELLTEYGGFSTHLGMKGDNAGYHEETAFQLRAQEDKKQIFYDKDLVVTHLVPDIKQNILYYLYSNYKSGKDGKYLWDSKYSYDELLQLFKDLDNFFMGLESSVKSRDIKEYPFAENYVVEKLAPMLFPIGSRLEYFSRHEAVDMEEYLKYFVKDRHITLPEYLRIYQALSTYRVDVVSLIDAYTEITGSKQSKASLLINYYQSSVSIGVLESIKYAILIVLFAKPIRKVIRKLRHLV